jgi:hypothetical protein
MTWHKTLNKKYEICVNTSKNSTCVRLLWSTYILGACSLPVGSILYLAYFDSESTPARVIFIIGVEWFIGLLAICSCLLVRQCLNACVVSKPRPPPPPKPYHAFMSFREFYTHGQPLRVSRNVKEPKLRNAK